VIKRKTKIIYIQVTIFLVALFLLYSTYRDTSEKVDDFIVIKTETDSDTNSFTDVKYSGFDLNGNRYILKAETADFENKTSELINMKGIIANFYLKDDTVLNVISDEGLYNSINLDMEFRKNVKATYLTNTLLSEKLTYSNSKGKLLASGNVRGESIEKGQFSADNVEYDLANKTLGFSMLGNKQVNVKLKN
jgi:hypothetical protein